VEAGGVEPPSWRDVSKSVYMRSSTFVSRRSVWAPNVPLGSASSLLVLAASPVCTAWLASPKFASLSPIGRQSRDVADLSGESVFVVRSYVRDR